MNSNRYTTKSAFKGTFVLIIRNYIFIFGNLLISIYASTILNIGDIGIYNLGSELVIFVSIIIVFGFSHAILKHIPLFESTNESRKASALAYYSWTFTCLIGLIASSTLFFFKRSFSILLFNDEIHENFMLFISIWILFVPNEVMSQIFISRYDFKKYLLANLLGECVLMIVRISLLITFRTIEAYFFSIILSEALKFVIFTMELFLTFRKPDFSLSFKKIIRYSMPFFAGNILNYFQFSISNLIVYFYFHDLQQIGILYYINFLNNLISNIFNSWHQVLVSLYSPVIYGENSKEKYKIMSQKISKYFQFLTFFIGLGFMAFVPVYVSIITTLYHYYTVFYQAVLTLYIFGLRYIFVFFDYVSPSIIVIEKGSIPILTIHAKVSGIYLLCYVITIAIFGLPGIPLSFLIGNLIFYYLIRRRVETHAFEIGFNKVSLRSIIIASIPAFLAIPTIYFCVVTFKETIILSLIFFEIEFPIVAFLLSAGIFFVMMGAMLSLLRHFKFFSQDDADLLNQLLGKRLFGLISKFIYQRQAQN